VICSRLLHGKRNAGRNSPYSIRKSIHLKLDPDITSPSRITELKNINENRPNKHPHGLPWILAARRKTKSPRQFPAEGLVERSGA